MREGGGGQEMNQWEKKWRRSEGFYSECAGRERESDKWLEEVESGQEESE